MYQLKDLYDTIEQTEHHNKMESKLKSLDYNVVIMAIKDYLYYGYSFNDVITYTQEVLHNDNTSNN